HDDRVDGGRHRDLRVVQDLDRHEDGQRRVVHADLHRRSDRLRAGHAEQFGDEVADEQAAGAEEGGNDPDVGDVVTDAVDLGRDDADDQDEQDDRRADADGPVHPGGEVGLAGTDQHAEPDRHQDQGEDLDDLDQGHGDVVATVVVGDRGSGDQRQGDDGDQRVDGRERDVEGDVTAEESTEEGGGRAAGRGREQHHADAQGPRQVEGDDQAETDEWHRDELARQRDEGGLRLAPHAFEVGDREVQP